MPFAAAHAISRSFSAAARPRRRQSRRTTVRPCSAFGRLAVPPHQARVADDLVACERDERAAGQRRLLGEPALELDVDPLDRHVLVALLRERPGRAESSGRDSIETNSTPSMSRGAAARRRARAPASRRGASPRSRSGARTRSSARRLRRRASPRARTRARPPARRASSGAPCRRRGRACPAARAARRAHRRVSDRFMRPLPASSPSRSASRWSVARLDAAFSSSRLGARSSGSTARRTPSHAS